MDIHFSLLFAATAILLAMVLRPLEKYSHIPFPVLLVVLGFVLSETFILLGFDTGIRSSNFQWISQYIFIPIIIFASAYHISPKLLIKDSITHFLFALPITLVTIVITTIGLYYGINHPTGFPWIAALLTASILSATGAHAIADYLRSKQVAERIIQILQFESIFTGVLAILFFNWFLSIAKMQVQMSISYWLLSFIMLLIGGVLIGIILGYVVLACFYFVKNVLAQGILLISAVYMAYFLAQIWEVSAGVAVFSMGFMLGGMAHKYFTQAHHFLAKLWDYYYLLAISGLFLLVGIVITWDMFVERWLAMLIGIVAILVGRTIGVYVSLGFENISGVTKRFDIHEQNLLILSGIRAALPIALAFAIPTSLDYWWTIQSIVFGVVLFTLLVQAPICGLLWQKFHRPEAKFSNSSPARKQDFS